VLDVLGTTTMVTTRSTLCIADACMLAKQFDDTKWTEQDSSTLIEFNPYCFGKIVDHLRLKRLHSLGFIANEPTLLPKVRDSQKKTFDTPHLPPKRPACEHPTTTTCRDSSHTHNVRRGTSTPYPPKYYANTHVTELRRDERPCLSASPRIPTWVILCDRTFVFGSGTVPR